MELFTHNVKKIKGAAYKNGDVDGRYKWDLIGNIGFLTTTTWNKKASYKLV